MSTCPLKMLTINTSNITGVFLEPENNLSPIDVIGILKRLNEELSNEELVDSETKKFIIQNSLYSE